MIVQMMPEGPSSLFNIATFGRPDNKFQETLRADNLKTQQMLMSNHGIDMSRFFQNSTSFFTNMHSMSGYDKAEQMIEMGKVLIESVEAPKVFTPITHVGQLVTTNPYQQALLMANPVVQTRVATGELNGYADTYINVYGDGVGINNPLYRKVVDGMEVSDYWTEESGLPQPNENCDSEYHYFYDEEDDVPENMRNVTVIERHNAMRAWLLQNVLISEGIDPTHKELAETW